MSDSIREMGPVDWLLIEFEEPLTGHAVAPLNELVRRGTVRVLDIVFIRKSADGTVQAVDISDLRADESVDVPLFDDLSTGILSDEELRSAGDALAVDSRAIMLVYENAWAAPFATAIREAGGTLVDSGRVPR